MIIWIRMRGGTRWKLHNHHTWPRERRGVLEYKEEWVRYALSMLDETMRTNVRHGSSLCKCLRSGLEEIEQT